MSYDESDLDRDHHRPCPWPSCHCTHQGCIGGWIDKGDDEKGDRAVPCSTCRPEVAAHFRKPAPMRRLRAELLHLERPSRHAKKDGPW